MLFAVLVVGRRPYRRHNRREGSIGHIYFFLRRPGEGPRPIGICAYISCVMLTCNNKRLLINLIGLYGTIFRPTCNSINKNRIS